MITEQNQRVTKAILMSLEGVNLPEDNGWIKRQEFIGVDVPVDAGELELLYHYITTEVVLGADDFMALTTAHTQALYGSMVRKEDIEAFKDKFLGQIRQSTAFAASQA